MNEGLGALPVLGIVLSATFWRPGASVNIFDYVNCFKLFVKNKPVLLFPCRGVEVFWLVQNSKG